MKTYLPSLLLMIAFTAILGVCYWGIGIILFPISILNAFILAGITDVLILTLVMIKAGVSLFLQVINGVVMRKVIAGMKEKAKKEGSVYDHFFKG